MDHSTHGKLLYEKYRNVNYLKAKISGFSHLKCENIIIRAFHTRMKGTHNNPVWTAYIFAYSVKCTNTKMCMWKIEPILKMQC